VALIAVLGHTMTAQAQEMAIATTAAEATVPATDSSTELAKQLANPVASLISVPLQFNCDERTSGRMSKARGRI